jgi:hypothetical protein
MTAGINSMDPFAIVYTKDLCYTLRDANFRSFGGEMIAEIIFTLQPEIEMCKEAAETREIDGKCGCLRSFLRFGRLERLFLLDLRGQLIMAARAVFCR